MKNLRIVSILIRAIYGIRINKTEALFGIELNSVLISGLYAHHQGAYLNTYTTGLKKRELECIIGKYVPLNNTDALKAKLDEFIHIEIDAYSDVVFDAFLSMEDYPFVLSSKIPDHLLEHYSNIFRKSRNILNQLMDENIIDNVAKIRNIAWLAWYWGRAAFIARCSFDLGLLNESELKSYLNIYFRKAHDKCSTWNVFLASYILGREIWGGANNDGMILLAKDLLENRKSPFNEKVFFN